MFGAAASTLDLADGSAWLALSTLFVLQLALTLLLLSLVALVSVRLAKAVGMLLFVVNAAALYFIHTYGVLIDKTMVGNVFNTDPAEAWGLFHVKLLLYVAVLGVLPALAIAATRVRRPGIVKQLAFTLSVAVAGAGWLYANSASWLWIDKHASRLGSLVLPWSYVINAARYQSALANASREQVPLPAATHVDDSDVIVVLVIGESARAKNFSLYGYGRSTNPELAAAGAVPLANTTSCATYTTESLQCMLSSLGSKTPFSDSHEPLPSYVQRNGVDVTWRANNSGEPRMKVGRFEIAPAIRKTCTGDCSRLQYDDVLLYGLDAQLREAGSRKKLFVLHQTGSHGPQYFNRYPPRFETFTPVCRTVEQSKCTTQELVNAYDNTIRYTDHFLASVVALLKAQGTPAVMLYVSDHGESLGEHGLYLHGTPMALAPDEQKDVPFIVWMSDSFAQRKGVQAAVLRAQPAHSHDFVFHSVMGALGMAGPAYDRSLDIFSPATKASP